jgi:tetratricopeptide (TPR) repeat protein
VPTVVTLALLIALGTLSSPTLRAQQKRPSTRDFAAISTQAAAARDADRLDEALTLYRKALTLRPGWAEGWWSLGTIQYDRSAYITAAHAFERVLALKPKDGTALAMLGLCEFELGHDAAAFRHIEESRKIGIAADSQLQHVVLYHEAVLLQRKGKFETAQEDLEQLCLQEVQSNDIANTLGLVLLRRTDPHPPAEGSVEAGIVLELGHAGCLAGQKKYEEGRRILAKVVGANPKYRNLHYAYGMFLQEAQDQSAAIAEFQQELSHNPKHVYARLRIAAALYKTNSAAGIPYAEQAVNLAPAVPLGHYLLGLLLLDTDAYEKSIPELEIARQSFPRNARLYFALGSAYARAGRMREAAQARATFERLQKEVPEEPTAGEEPEGIPR